MAYKYDVFLSYSRMEPHNEWSIKMFYPLFLSYLKEELNRDAEIFVDTQGIEGGSNWGLKIKNALAHSRCMVSILSPAYFRSIWCVKEFSVIDYRQKQLGYNTIQNPTGLIVPLRIYDGQHFPQFVNEIQILDCRDFFRVGEGVKQTQLYIDLQTKILQWIPDVATSVLSAPDWNEDWLRDTWLEAPSGNYQINNEPKASQPIL